MTGLATVGAALHGLRTRLLPVRRGDLSFVAVALVVVFGSLLGIVVLQTLIVQNRVERDQVGRELTVAQEENQRLRLAVLELEAPGRIQDVAVGRLGMIRPGTRKYLPGVDPMTVPVGTPAAADPFGPAPLTEEQLALFFGGPEVDDSEAGAEESEAP